MPNSASVFAPLRHPVFRAVWVASMASNFGGMIQSVGASWLMTSISGSAKMVALVQVSVTLPIMLLSLVAGAAADNFNRRRMMLGAQLFMLLVSMALAACALWGLLTPWLLLSFTFLIGCGAAFNGPAWQASVRDMVPRDDLMAAVALNNMGFNIARSVGPTLGGAIVAAAGAVAAFAVNAMSYVVLIFSLWRWRAPATERKLPRERLGSAMLAGIRYAGLSPPIAIVLGRSLVFGFGASAISALMPLVARDVVAGGPITYGLMLGAFGTGAVGGALSSVRLRGSLSSEGMVRWACLAFGISAALSGFSSNLAATMVLLAAAGASWLLALSTFNVTVQLNSPRWVVARALSLYHMAAFGGMAAGSWTWGLVAETHGISTALLGGAAALAICAALGLGLPLPQTSDLNLEPLREWAPPHPVIDIEPRSGPVVVTIEFRIKQGDIGEFLATMGERRRVRRRDGARAWNLLQDVADPEVWTERFQIANWIEYQRLHNRMTQADALVTGRARALHLGPEPPLVRRMIERPVRGPSDAAAVILIEPLTDPRRFG